MKQAIKVIEALSIPPKMTFVYFFEPILSRNESIKEEA
jgi:hypothetical protein